MLKEADRARARAIEARLNSRRVTDGAFSIFGRLRSEVIKPMSESIAASNSSGVIDEDYLRRCVLNFVGQHPDAARSHHETTALLNRRRMNEQASVVVRDVNSALLAKLTPSQKLNFANTGRLPDKYILKGPNDA